MEMRGDNIESKGIILFAQTAMRKMSVQAWAGSYTCKSLPAVQDESLRYV